MLLLLCCCLLITKLLTKVTDTLAYSGIPYADECISDANESCLSLELLNPNTNNIASNMLDLPLPLGPMIHVKCLSNGPMIC